MKRVFGIVVLMFLVFGCQGVVEQTSTTTTTQRALTDTEIAVQQASATNDVSACEGLEGYAREACRFEAIKRSLAHVNSPDICEDFDQLQSKCFDMYYNLHQECENIQNDALKTQCQNRQ